VGDVGAALEEGVVPHVAVAVGEAGVGAGEVRVRGGEVVDRDARVGDQHEPLVILVQQRVGQQPTLCVHQGDVSPFRFLQYKYSGTINYLS
jgi:hypothetical protein